MEQRRFGSTDLTTSPIGFGTWEMSGTMYGEIDAAAASRAVGAAIDHGITLFDTAAVYGPFHSERLLARALGARRREVTLVTKVCQRLSDDETLDWRDRIGPRDGSYEHTIRAAEGCLQRLATDVIDLLLIHHRDFDTPIAETIGALERLRADGKIRYYGVSNHDVPMLEECRRVGRIATNQLPFNLFDRRVEPDILPWCAANGVGFMSYGTLGFGLLTGAFSVGHFVRRRRLARRWQCVRPAVVRARAVPRTGCGSACGWPSWPRSMAGRLLSSPSHGCWITRR